MRSILPAHSSASPNIPIPPSCHFACQVKLWFFADSKYYHNCYNRQDGNSYDHHEKNSRNQYPVDRDNSLHVGQLRCRLSCYRVRFGFDLKWPIYFGSRCKLPFYIPWLSPREPTGAASPIGKSKGSVVRAILAFDMHFWGRWPVAVTG